MIGRAFLYGLGAYGQDGVRRVLEILYKEMDTTMALCAAARSCRATAASCRAPIRSEAGRARLQSSHSRQYAPASRQTHSGVTMMSKQGGPVRPGKALRLLAARPWPSCSRQSPRPSRRRCTWA